jgi:hypothetical protein
MHCGHLDLIIQVLGKRYIEVELYIYDDCFVAFSENCKSPNTFFNSQSTVYSSVSSRLGMPRVLSVKLQSLAMSTLLFAVIRSAHRGPVTGVGLVDCVRRGRNLKSATSCGCCTHNAKFGRQVILTLQERTGAMQKERCCSCFQVDQSLMVSVSLIEHATLFTFSSAVVSKELLAIVEKDLVGVEVHVVGENSLVVFVLANGRGFDNAH